MTIDSKKAKAAILEVDPRLEALLVPLTTEESELLKENLIENGCLDPLLVWEKDNQRILVDGHNRYRICTQYGIDFQVKSLDFKNLEEVEYWMINNQLGRRNLTADQLSYYRGLKYLQIKKPRGGFSKVQSKGQSEPMTADVVAEEFKVSPSTIKRDANFAKGINTIGKSNPALKQEMLAGHVSFNKKDIRLLGESGKQFRIKNEADLYNKLESLKKDMLDGVEQQVDAISMGMEEPEVVENPFSSYEERVKRIKASILSNINIAIEKKDTSAILKLKDLVEKLAKLIES